MPPPFSHSWGFAAILPFYIFATFSYALRVASGRAIFSAVALRLTLIGFLVQLTFLILHLSEIGLPFFEGRFETYQVVGASVTATFLVLSFLPRRRFFALGIVLVPVALLFTTLSLTQRIAYSVPGHFLENPWAFVHLVFVSIGMAIFVAGFGTGILYIVREDRLKKKRVGGFLERLPSLEEMDLMYYRLLYTGFVFYTIGIITGGGWSKSVTGVYLSGDFKQILSLGIWVFFALFLNLRSAKGWIGKKGVLVSSAGFVAALILFTWLQSR